MYGQMNRDIFSDPGLTPVGIMQANYLAKTLHENGVEYDKICASPVKRATQTASHIAYTFLKNTDTEAAEVNVNGLFREKYDGEVTKFITEYINLDSLQGYIDTDLALSVALNMDRSEHFMEGKMWGIVEESEDDITARVEKGIQEEVSDMEDGQRLLIVAHGGISGDFSQKYGGTQGLPGHCEVRSFKVVLEDDGLILSVTPNTSPITLQPEDALSEEDKDEKNEKVIREFLSQEKYKSLEEFDRLSLLMNNFVEQKIAEIKGENQEVVQSRDVLSRENLVANLATSMEVFLRIKIKSLHQKDTLPILLLKTGNSRIAVLSHDVMNKIKTLPIKCVNKKYRGFNLLKLNPFFIYN